MAVQQQLDMASEHYEEICRILNRYLPNEIVWAYGSRVKFTANKNSDLDLVTFGVSDIQIGDTLEAFENSKLPFRVSLMLWESLPNDFQNNIKKCYVLINDRKCIATT